MRAWSGSGSGSSRWSWSRIVVATGACCAVLLGTFVGASAAAAAADQPRSVRDGVFTAAQAERGRDVYEGTCLTCHAARMWSDEWTGKSLWDLYDTITMFMPEDNPGSLSPQQVRDVLAYILETNTLPAGPRELPDDEDALKAIRIEPPAP